MSDKEDINGNNMEDKVDDIDDDGSMTGSVSGSNSVLNEMSAEPKSNNGTSFENTSTPKDRRKIEIKFIENKTRRHVTFSKRKHGIMKKAFELSVLTGTQVLLLIVSETGLVYTFSTPKFEPIVTQQEGRNLIQACLNAPDEDGEEDDEEEQDEDHGDTQNGNPDLGSNSQTDLPHHLRQNAVHNQMLDNQQQLQNPNLLQQPQHSNQTLDHQALPQNHNPYPNIAMGDMGQQYMKGQDHQDPTYQQYFQDTS
ncbi:SRF-type transcription factor (DNA-binding and dimerization domain) [Nakaseomyces glabratus]|nr:SRF-type transcription factor (DNA-binding and dimerization domain) [Nakaseomyces glabratus]KAH7590545.1 SRF-type transcription factor (DNA-binding and dimerization domain) [Nakaseomyces glabratus]KAI8386086.1 SRF-type transcription factor (DNA-binding and dimerization domain) [Nakaseomyces glabratus]QNG14868.1 MCM1 [Nakaseomyces glabratus]SCV16611.1 uncharacterized protein CGFF_04172 [Nakaseomyces glabratus]